MPMTLARVPNELISQIISNITDRRTLLTLLLVSRDVQYEAERALYHTIHYNNITSQLKKTLSDRSSLHCQRIAPFVRRLDNIFVQTNVSALYLRSILENLFNLHTLRLYYLPNIGSLLRGCSFRLHVLECTVSPDDTDWLQFLHTQTELVKLYWSDPSLDPMEQTIKPDIRLPIFPKLRVLGAPAAVTLVLLSTHPSVTNLFLLSQAGIDASRFLRIQSLGLGPRFTPQQYRSLANQFPNLRYLSGTIPPSETESQVFFNELAEDLIACIDRLKTLEKIELLIYHITTSEEGFLVSKLMGWHARLRTVVIIRKPIDKSQEWRDLSWANIGE